MNKRIDKNVLTKICFIIEGYNKTFKKFNHNNNNIYRFNNFIINVFNKMNMEYDTLCLSLYYFIKLKLIILNKNHYNNISTFLLCGRRMFIICLIISNKYLKDNSYKNISWAIITKLKNKDINLYEKYVLKILNYNIYISHEDFIFWEKKVKGFNKLSC